MKDITVGLFNDSFIPIMDGVTLTVRNYAYWLNKTLGPTYVVTPFVTFHTDNEPSRVIRFLSRPAIVRPAYMLGRPDLELKVQLQLKKRDFSIIHAHSPFGAGL